MCPFRCHWNQYELAYNVGYFSITHGFYLINNIPSDAEINVGDFYHVIVKYNIGKGFFSESVLSLCQYEVECWLILSPLISSMYGLYIHHMLT